MRTKLNDIYLAVRANDFDLIVLTETWLNECIYDSEIFDERYLVFRRDRSSNTFEMDSDGGGVLVAVKRSISSYRNSNFESRCEDLWVTLLFGNIKLHVCCIYLPSPLKRPHLEEFLIRSGHVLDDIVDDVFLFGDFNQGAIRWSKSTVDASLKPNNYDSANATALVDFLSAYDLKQFNHVVNHQQKTLDLVLSNSSCGIMIQKSQNVISRVDLYHPPLEIHLSLQGPRVLTPRYTPRHNFFRADYEAINNCLDEVDWNSEFDRCLTVDDIVSRFYAIVNQVIAENVPVQRQYKKKYPPWFSVNLILMLREKEKARLKYKKFKNGLDELEFNILKGRINVMIKKCYKSYIQKVVNSVTKNPKYFWTYIKSKRKVKGDIPSVMNLGDRIARGGDSIANLFADNFALSYNSVRSNAPVDTTPQSQLSSDISLSQLFIKSDRIKLTLKSLDPSKGAGSDGIHPIFLKNCATSLTKPLSIIYNRSLSDGCFPEVWKDAVIVPIHKAGDKSNVNNYRPISILPVLGKVLESLVCPHLSWHIKQAVADQQHGFLRKRSTATNLLTFVDRIISIMSSGMEVDAIYTDFSKAFDKVDHALLIHKLNNIFGIHGSLLNWFSSYLRNRKQRVVVNGFASKEIHPSSGVPQGSHLGPILFVMFIDDIKHCIIHSEFELYADDLKLSKTVQNVEDQVKLQEDLDRISDWCELNHMTLNSNKCSHIKFSRKFIKFSTCYHINGSVLNRVDEIKDLGIIIDSEMKFTNHINNTINKCLRMLAFIFRNTKEFKSVQALKILYFSLVRSHVEYCSFIWYPFYQNNIQRIERIQKKFLTKISFINGTYRSVKGYSERLDKFGMLSLWQRKHQLSMIFLYKLLNHEVDCPSLLSQINVLVPRVSARLHNYEPFSVTVRRNKYGSSSPMCTLMNFFNKLFRDHNIDIFYEKIGAFKKIIFDCLRYYNK